MNLAKLGKAVERVDLDLQFCTEALAVFKPIGLGIERRVLEQFKDTYSAHVVEVLQHALYRDALLVFRS